MKGIIYGIITDIKEIIYPDNLQYLQDEDYFNDEWKICYVGATINPLKNRLKDHMKDKRSALRSPVDYVNLYGRFHFDIILLEEFEGTKEKFRKREYEISKAYMKTNHLLNRRIGDNWTEESIQERLLYYKKNPMSEKRKQNISKALTGRTYKGKPMKESTKKKLSKINNGKKLPQETKDKISNSLKGRKGPNKGKKLSEKWKKHIGEANKGHKSSKKVVQMTIERNKDRCRKVIELDSNIIYKNIMIAAQELNIKPIQIRHMLHHRKINFYNGYSFMFYDEYIKYIEEIKNNWIID